MKRMQNIRTSQNLINRSVPASRAQLVSRLARLEHERERLLRERQLWLNKQRQCEQRIDNVAQQIAAIEQALTPRQPIPTDYESEWQAMTLEY